MISPENQLRLFEEPRAEPPAEPTFDAEAYSAAVSEVIQTHEPYEEDPQALAERRDNLAELGSFSDEQADILTRDFHYQSSDINPGHSDTRRIDTPMHPAPGQKELEIADRQPGPALGPAEWGGQREETLEERQQFLERRRQYEQSPRDTSDAEALMDDDGL